MYLRKLSLTDFRAFERLEWRLNDGEEAGWHVLIGPNGSGKSSFLRAAAIAFTGETEFTAARRPTVDFVRKAPTVEKATIAVELSQAPSWDTWEGQGRQSSSYLKGTISLLSNGSITASGDYTRRTIWGKGRGWFSAAFGPMRRFTGGNPENLRLFTGYPRLARHLSIFGEDVALTEALEWLRTLRFKQLERAGTDSDGLLAKVRHFVNQPGFLPHAAKLKDVTSEAVSFEDGNGVPLPIIDLSDGYRAVLSMTFELIRLMGLSYGDEGLFSGDATQVVAPGVVLIDEIDAHLHPSWQREIGPWLTKLFPAVQFIVTTHSPYVCQTAVRGSVWTLPAPGEQGELHRLEGEQLTRVLYGDVLHALNSEAFGGLPGRSEVATHLLDRLAELNRASDLGTLSDPENFERGELAEKLRPVVGGEEQ
jgi:predicted ATPase